MVTATLDGRLPVPLSGLVGRARELDTLAAMLGAARLVSIVGPGGVGKTRVALSLAHAAAADFPDGAWWIGLGDIAAPGLVAATVVSVCGLAQTPGEEPAAALAAHFRERRALLVLDNCEHLIDECASLAVGLLSTCAGLKVLATSREPLGLGGERVFRLGGLGCAMDEAPGAVALFLERLQTDPAGRPAPNSSELAEIALICERLDGLALAVELAAARAGVLGVADIARRLEEADTPLRRPDRAAPARHRTLDGALDWSYALLSDAERRLFVALSVFRGSFSLLAAEALAPALDVARGAVIEGLAALVEKSLVPGADRGAERRYRLLHTIHAYSAERLAQLPEREALAGAHSEFFLGLAQQARDGLEGSEQARWLDRVELEHDNLRAVLRRDLDARPEAAGRLAALLWPFWYRRGYYHEARSWLEQAEARVDSMGAEVAAPALRAAGAVAFLQCDYALAAERLGRARELYDGLGDLVGIASVLQRLGSIAREQARYEEARRLHTEARALWSRLGEAGGVAASEDYLAFVAWLEGDGAAAAAHAERALAHFEAEERGQETAAALINHGMAAACGGERTQALERLRRALAISQEISYLEGVAWSSHELGALSIGEDDGAVELLRDGLRTHVALGDRWRVASVLETIATLVLAPSDPRRAVTVIAAAARLREELGAPVPAVERPPLGRAEAELLRTLGEEGYARAAAEGAGLGLDRVVELALAAELEPGASGARPAAGGAEQRLRRRARFGPSRAHAPRGRGAAADQPRSHQPADRRRALHQPGHRRDPRLPHPAQARRRRAGGGGRDRAPARSRRRR